MRFKRIQVKRLSFGNICGLFTLNLLSKLWSLWIFYETNPFLCLNNLNSLDCTIFYFLLCLLIFLWITSKYLWISLVVLFHITNFSGFVIIVAFYISLSLILWFCGYFIFAMLIYISPFILCWSTTSFCSIYVMMLIDNHIFTISLT